MESSWRVEGVGWILGAEYTKNRIGGGGGSLGEVSVKRFGCFVFTVEVEREGVLGAEVVVPFHEIGWETCCSHEL